MRCTWSDQTVALPAWAEAAVPSLQYTGIYSTAILVGHKFHCRTTTHSVHTVRTLRWPPPHTARTALQPQPSPPTHTHTVRTALQPQPHTVRMALQPQPHTARTALQPQLHTARTALYPQPHLAGTVLQPQLHTARTVLYPQPHTARTALSPQAHTVTGNARTVLQPERSAHTERTLYLCSLWVPPLPMISTSTTQMGDTQ